MRKRTLKVLVPMAVGALVSMAAAAHVACSTVADGPSGRGVLPHGGGAGVAGPPHRLLHSGSGAWTLVSPQGRPYFSVGVSCVDQGLVRAEYDPENPAYAAWRHYPDERAWCDATLGRLRQWGFTTVGGWGDFDVIRRWSAPGSPNGSSAAPSAPSEAAPGDGSLLFTPVLHIGATVGAPWVDMWDDKLLARMDRAAGEQIVRLRDDPRVVGYYSDNELGWWNATLFKMTIEHPAASGQRRRLVALLKEHYRGDWPALRRDFFAEGAEGWSQLGRGGTLHPRPGRGAMPVLRQFLGIVAERYYRLMHDTIRRYDRRALILGDRYQSFYYPEVAAAAGPYVDVVSTNLNAAWDDGTFPRFYLDTLNRLTGKPVLVSEVYMAASENRSGNRNTRGIFPVVATQADRAAAARTTLEAVARLPQVVGVEWFQYHDEPRRGRPDGENFNFGLVDIQNRPYDALVDTFLTFDPMAVRAARTRARARADATGGIPPAPADPFVDFEVTRAIKHWDRERGFVPPVQAGGPPTADLYACWSPRALYLGVYCLDLVEKAFYRDGRMPKEDRMLWTVGVNGDASRTIRARLGGARDPLISNPAVRLENLSGVDLNVRNVAAMELPAALFGKAEFKPGDRVTFTAELSTHSAAYTTRWEVKDLICAQ